MEFDNYEYSIETDNKKIVVTPVTEQKIPEQVGKFFSLSKEKIDSLCKGKIYATELEKLNDIFEGSQIIGLCDDIANKALATDPNKDDKHRMLRGLSIAKYGLISLCNTPESPTLWGLYTNYEGFFLEFNAKRFIDDVFSLNQDFHFSNLIPIRYVERNRMKDFNEMLCKFSDREIARVAALHTKLSDWKFEDEYRLIVSHFPDSYDKFFKTSGYYYSYPPQAKTSREMDFSISSIERIILGMRFFRPESLANRDENKQYYTISKLEKDGVNETLRLNLIKFIIGNKIPVFCLRFNYIETYLQPYKVQIELQEDLDQIIVEHFLN